VAFDFLRILTSTVSCLWETVPYAEGTGASSDPRDRKVQKLVERIDKKLKLQDNRCAKNPASLPKQGLAMPRPILWWSNG